MEQFRRTAKLNGGNGCFAPKSAGGETIQASEDHVRFSGMMASLSALLGRMHPNVRHNRATHLHCGWFDPQNSKLPHRNEDRQHEISPGGVRWRTDAPKISAP
jgi:hypothetical protein